ncbi:hypothetical protein [Endozoicomonas euniceicola]|uniref:Uncharacterized protein n=1 Tax=Endozoicomonas euniceicola TaxID=1234143 RepID=A0ABY6GQB8_9GAMM|nr:hypothetical protein [Endozoicomonas euniceicola]UYM14943.1 hypothetical protein NX720_18920 [Endozoicomonas euniceicola]
MLFTPSAILAGTTQLSVVASPYNLLPVPPEYGCPSNALSCVLSEGKLKFLPDNEPSLPARFLLGSKNGTMPVYYLEKRNSDKTLPENGQAVQYLKARFEILTSQNIVVIAQTKTGAWQVSRFDLKLADENWDNSIFIPKGYVAVLQKDHENLTLTVQFSNDERPANGLIVDSEGIVYRGDNPLWLSEPEDESQVESGRSGNNVSGDTVDVVTIYVCLPWSFGGTEASGGAAAGGAGGGDDGDKGWNKIKGTVWWLSDSLEADLKEKTMKELIKMLGELPSSNKKAARGMIDLILQKNLHAHPHHKLAEKSVDKIIRFIEIFYLGWDKDLVNRVETERYKKRSTAKSSQI